VAFGRFANTRIGLSSMLAVVTLLAVWALVSGHRIVGIVLVLLATALGAHLWRTEAERSPAQTPSPPIPATAPGTPSATT
jgi:hypothetical protein